MSALLQSCEQVGRKMLVLLGTTDKQSSDQVTGIGEGFGGSVGSSLSLE